MGNNLFGANISGKLAKRLGRRLPRGTLRRETEGARDASNLSAGRAKTTVDHSFRGYESGIEVLHKNTIMPDTRSSVYILGDTVKPLTVPIVNDIILLGNDEFTVVAVSSDPDRAGYTLQVK